uniref:Hint domain-containing protein n=1 Tax=Alexandrium catenella TaxID=2925 RepID=A0A7S1QC51_ALECA|mmetsp:Transcript_24451/g.66767  ORF Transcript_24451/g.66767 Transcript_24451/m.66767 type:complete len:398 (+) Transcript_24451:24-1217(+)
MSLAEDLYRSGLGSVANFSDDYLCSDFAESRLQERTPATYVDSPIPHDVFTSLTGRPQTLHQEPWVRDESAAWRRESWWWDWRGESWRWDWSEHEHGASTWSDRDANGASTWDHQQALTEEAESSSHVHELAPRADRPRPLELAPPRWATLLEGSVPDGAGSVGTDGESASEASFASDQSATSQNSWMSACSEGPRCFLPETLLQRHDGCYVQAADLEKGLRIASACGGEPLTVAAIKRHTVYQLVELIAGSTQFTVTPSHRVVVADAEDAAPVLARDLEPDRKVMCAAGSHTLQEVRKFSKPDGQEVFEVRFHPDGVVAAFMPPGPILTMGGRRPIRRGGVQRRWGRGASSGSRGANYSADSDVDSRLPTIPDTDSDLGFPQHQVQSAPFRSSAGA